MPNIKSSIRSVKTDAGRRAANGSVKSAVRTATRKVNEMVATGKSSEAKDLLPATASIIDKAAAKGILHKNTAARKKSRLAKRVNG